MVTGGVCGDFYHGVCVFCCFVVLLFLFLCSVVVEPPFEGAPVCTYGRGWVYTTRTYEEAVLESSGW
jgi:hypothetical protein